MLMLSGLAGATAWSNRPQPGTSFRGAPPAPVWPAGDAEDKAELLEIIEAYRVGQVPLVVPMTLLNHHFRRHPTPYVKDQYYLEPHPKELMLRNVL